MHYPAFGLAFGVLLGIFHSQELIAPWAALIAAFAGGYGCLRVRGLGWAGLFLLCLGFILGTLAVSSTEKKRAGETLQTFAPAECLSVEGLVSSLPAVKRQGRRERVQFVLSAERLLRLAPDCSRGKAYDMDGGRMLIESVSGRIQVFLVNPAVIPEPGDRVRVFGRMHRPHVPRNPGEMDYRRYLESQGITVIFSGLGSASLVVRTLAASGKLSVQIDRFRQRLAERIDSAFGPSKKRYAGMIKALILGIRTDLPEDLRDKMMRTGTAHLIAISGLHMTVFSASAYALIFFVLGRRRPAAAAALLFTCCYVFISGCGLPVQRAAVMSGAVYLAWILERRAHALHLLAWACVVLLLKDPFSVGTVSFQLSFLSVFFLLILGYLPPAGIWLEAVRATAWVIAGTLPAAAYHFNRISWSALPANLWAVPFFNLALLSGAGTLAAAGTPVLGSFFTSLSVLMLDWGLAGIEKMASWQGGWRFVPVPSALKVMHYYVWMAVCFYMLRKRPRKLLFAGMAAAGWLASALFFFAVPDSAAKQATFLAGSRGLLVHLQSQGRHWFINPGRPAPVRETERKVLAYLRHHGIGQLQGMVLTGYGLETPRALDRLKEELTIKTLIGPMPQKQAVSFLNRTGMPWTRMGERAAVAGDFRIRSECRDNRCHALEIRLDDQVLAGWINRLDAESRHFFKCPKNHVPVLYFQGSASRSDPEDRKIREALVRACRTKLVLFDAAPHRVFFDLEGIQTVDLARSGAVRLQVETSAVSVTAHPSGESRLILMQPLMTKDVIYRFRL